MTGTDGRAVPASEPSAAAAASEGAPEQAEHSAPRAPLLTLSAPLPPVVDTAPALARTVAAVAAGSGPMALDAERASGYRYSSRAYLVQLRRAGAGTALIDPVPFGDVPNDSLTALAAAVSDAEWIIHAASQDLPCLAELGMRPRRLFDTELAGRLLNYPRVGLAVLVEELLGRRMRKEHSAVDWSRRPLPPDWLTYAALDVEPLVELRDVLAAQLDAAGKTEWARQEFAAWATAVTPPRRAERWRRTSGIHRVRGRRALAIVRAMAERRDEIAARRDVAVSRILPDATIVAAATAAPRTRNALARLEGFASRAGMRYVREFHEAVSAALELPEAALPPVASGTDGPPPPRSWPDKNPAAAARLARCREAVGSLAAHHEVPQENLLAPDAVRRLAWSPPVPATPSTVAEFLTGAGARQWQVELTADDLATALAADDDSGGRPATQP